MKFHDGTFKAEEVATAAQQWKEKSKFQASDFPQLDNIHSVFMDSGLLLTANAKIDSISQKIQCFAEFDADQNLKFVKIY
jgi:hypothetical protein